MKLRAVFFVGSAAWLLACGDEGGAPTVTTPGPASIVITSLYPRANTVWNHGLDGNPDDPQPIELDCDGRLGVSVALLGLDTTETISWAFRSPDACGSSPNCGYLRIDLDPEQALTPSTVDACDDRTGTDSSELNASASCRSGASAVLAFDLSAQRDQLAGSHTLRAALYRDSRTPMSDRTGEPLLTEIQVEFATPSCAPAGEGGAPGEPSAGAGGAAAGAGGEGGG